MPFATLVHRHPMRTAAAAMLDAERALEEIQRQFSTYPSLHSGARRSQTLRIRAVESEHDYTVTAELPGVEADRIDVLVEDGVLTLKVAAPREASASDEAPAEGAESANADAEWQGLQRTIRFNGEIDAEAVSASYKNGLLEVTVPKLAPPAPEVRTIPVEVG